MNFAEGFKSSFVNMQNQQTVTSSCLKATNSDNKLWFNMINMKVNLAKQNKFEA